MRSSPVECPAWELAVVSQVASGPSACFKLVAFAFTFASAFAAAIMVSSSTSWAIAAELASTSTFTAVERE